MTHSRSHTLLIYLGLELELKTPTAWGSSSIAVANDLASLCLEFFLGKKKLSQHESSPLSRATSQVVLIKHPASPEPLDSQITNLSKE